MAASVRSFMRSQFVLSHPSLIKLPAPTAQAPERFVAKMSKGDPETIPEPGDKVIRDSFVCPLSLCLWRLSRGLHLAADRLMYYTLLSSSG